MENVDIEKLKEKVKRKILIQADKNFLELIDKVSNHVKIDEQIGVVLVSDRAKKLGAWDKIVTVLLLERAGKYLDMRPKKSMNIDEVCLKTSLSRQVALSRLSELSRDNVIINLVGGSGRGKIGDYYLTDYGVEHFQKKVLPKLGEKMEASG